MGNEELSTIPEKESNEFIKSSVEDLVLIPSKSKDSSEIDDDEPSKMIEDQNSIHHLSGSPTLYSDPVVASLSPSLTPTRDSDSIMEETDTLLPHHDSTSPEVDEDIFDLEGDIRLPHPHELNNEIFDPERDILFLENLLKDDPSEAKNSEVDSLIKEPSDTFLMRNEDIKLKPPMDVDIKNLAPDSDSTLKMLISYVSNLPTGDEAGIFYALDLGGTNFRVLRVKLGGGGEARPEFTEVSIPQSRMTGTCKELFDFIAGKLAEFIATEGEDMRIPPGTQRQHGFTFSFPVKQTSIDRGTLETCQTNVYAKQLNKDMVVELTKCMEEAGIDMRVAALVNDTVGTLARGKYSDPDVIAAVILGTGTNAAYIERVDAIPKWEGTPPKSREMVINMEWGNFQSPHLPLMEYDESLDANSKHPEKQIFEKMISGMYLGEIVRLVLLKMAQAHFFGDIVPPKLEESSVLMYKNKYGLLIMHHDSTDDLKEVATILEDKLECNTTTIGVFPSDISGFSPATCRWGNLSPATCRWGIVAGEYSSGIQSPAIIPSEDVGPTRFSVKQFVPRWQTFPQRHVAGDSLGLIKT
ncbi:hexokinase [Tanacetum coccineum]